MTEQEMIARVRELDKAATPGPWINDHHAKRFGAGYTFGPDCAMVADQCPDCEGIRRRGVGGRLPQEQNGDLIAEYRSLAPQLADALDAHAAKIEQMREFLRPDPFCAQDCVCDVSMRYRKFNALFPPTART